MEEKKKKMGKSPKQPDPKKVLGSNKGGGTGKDKPLPDGAPGGLIGGATKAQDKNKPGKSKKPGKK